MAKKLTDAFLKTYQSYKETDQYDEAYKWEAYKYWSEVWNWQAEDKIAMLKACFKKDIAENLWRSRNYYPVKMLIGFIKVLGNEKPIAMINNLFDENIDLTERILEFKSTSKDLLKEYNLIENTQNKQSYMGDRFGSLLLSLQYPSKYAYYKYGVFKSFMNTINETRVKMGDDENYQYFMHAINEMVAEIKEYPIIYKRYQDELVQKEVYDDPGLMLLAQDMMYVNFQIERKAKNEKLLESTYDESINYYILGSKYGENYDVDIFPEMKAHNVISTGFAGDYNLQEFIGSGEEKIKLFLEEKGEKRNAITCLKKFVNIKPGDRVAIKGSGAPRGKKAYLSIIAIAEVIDEGMFYTHSSEVLGHKISVKWLETDIFREYELGYGSTLHKLSKREEIESLFYGSDRHNFNHAKDKTRQKKPLQKFPCNQILYGPPGTGKTYETITRALEILGVDYSSEDREKTVKLYNSHVQNKDIAFITFHQSMGYEDFIEGIKPVFADDDGNEVVDSGSSNLQYSVKPGIFMKMCAEAAYDNFKQYQVETKVTFDQLYDRYISDLKKKIDAGEPKRILTKRGFPILLERINRNDSIITIYDGEGTPSQTRPKRKEHLRILYSKIDSVEELNTVKEIGPIIGTRGGMSSYYAVFKDLKNFEKTLDKSTIDSDEEVEDTKDIISNFKAGQYNDVSFDDSSPRKVLIIDEINRGNVSSIFGELITLLEEDKRIGSVNQITTALPYSPEASFGVPKNLFIIGTMNTADRSVEALDTALRRRFTFIEKMPDPAIIDSSGNPGKSEVSGIKLSQVLETINTRIEALVDRDHTIGHSYFLNIQNANDLLDTFKNKIIPLLQEYFYNDYYKLLLVLGRGFVREVKNENTQSLFAIENVEVDFADNRYELNSLDDGFKIIEAIEILLNQSKNEND